MKPLGATTHAREIARRDPASRDVSSRDRASARPRESRSRRSATAIIRASLLLVSLGGCRVYDPALVQAEPDAGPCDSRQPPPRPSGADGDGPEVSFGLRMVVMTQGDDWPRYGYDLDGICTTTASLVGECTPPAGARAPADGPGGVDNVFGDEFFPLVSLTTPQLESDSRMSQERGQGLPIVRIRGWNGEANDARVDIAVMQAVFGAPGGDETTPPPAPADPDASRPTWNGRDWFWVRDDAFLMGDLDEPNIRDDNAYIADRVFVTRLPDRVDVIFPAEDAGVLVRITGATVTGRISEDGMTVEDVIVSGRWGVGDLLSTARNVGICSGERDYDLLVSQLDRIADVRSIPGSGGPGVECNAISVGVGFTGTRMRVADTATGLALADLCAAVPDGGVGDDGGMSLDAGLDAGPIDAGPIDAGVEDAGTDAGTIDAATIEPPVK